MFFLRLQVKYLFSLLPVLYSLIALFGNRLKPYFFVFLIASVLLLNRFEFKLVFQLSEPFLPLLMRYLLLPLCFSSVYSISFQYSILEEFRSSFQDLFIFLNQFSGCRHSCKKWMKCTIRTFSNILRRFVFKSSEMFASFLVYIKKLCFYFFHPSAFLCTNYDAAIISFWNYEQKRIFLNNSLEHGMF